MKVKLGSIPYVYPIPIVLAGANVHGKPNYTTVGDCGIMGITPPLVYVSSHREHYLNLGILENGTYSINFPSTDLLAVTDYCGIVSGRETDKSLLFETFYGGLGTAPMIQECRVNLECVVVKEFCIQHRQVFVGEVIQAYVDEEFVTQADGRCRVADLTRLDPIVYALDNRYYRMGEAIGLGYREGKDYAHPTR
ncbi:MAG: flavin reductase family protein [Anaerolineales bacterium]|nr:MAG: flavin reductase family protein [Anaerolineales bacterium]